MIRGSSCFRSQNGQRSIGRLAPARLSRARDLCQSRGQLHETNHTLFSRKKNQRLWNSNIVQAVPRDKQADACLPTRAGREGGMPTRRRRVGSERKIAGSDFFFRPMLHDLPVAGPGRGGGLEVASPGLPLLHPRFIRGPPSRSFRICRF